MTPADELALMDAILTPEEWKCLSVLDDDDAGWQEYTAEKEAEFKAKAQLFQRLRLLPKGKIPR
jgi:hypothetical protein